MATPRPASAKRTLRLIFEALEDRTLLDSSLLAGLSASHYRTDSLLVQYQPESQPALLLGGTIRSAISLVPGLYEVKIPSGITLAQALDAYAADPHVISAQPDYYVSTEALPNDPKLNQQWAYVNSNPAVTINAAKAWDTTSGSGQSIVAVIDTGIDLTHPDLVANLWRNTGEVPGNQFDDDGNGYIDDIHGYNFVSKNGNPSDDHGHGTHVAGILGARGNNGVGVTGVNWNVKIMALKFLNSSGVGSTSDALRALNYAVQMGATISNNSWTAPAYDSALEAGIRNAGLTGHIYVAAAGNFGQNLATIKRYPASYALDNVVTVAGLDSSNRLASWSNYGTAVEIAAPGANIYSTLRGGQYGYMSGTSMATPFVAGALALVRDLNPTWTAQQVIQRVLSTADTLSTLTGKISGGKLNLGAAIGDDNHQPPSDPPQDITGAKVIALANLIANNRINGLRVTFNEPIQLGSFDSSDVLSLTGPSGPLSVTGIRPVVGNASQFDILFAEQTQTGSYSVTLNTGILDAASNALNQNANGINGEVPGDRYLGTVNFTATNTYPAAGMPALVRDYAVNTYPINVPDSMVIGSVRVQINVTHGWMSDMVIKLRSPGGTEVLLANRRGGGGKGYSNTIFDDAAVKPIQLGSWLFTGAHRPEAPLSAFKGKSTNGTWSLIIEDKARGDGGTILGWSLTFDASNGSGSAVGRKSTRATAYSEIVSALRERQTLRVQLVQSQSLKIARESAAPTAQPSPKGEAMIVKSAIQQHAQQLIRAWQEEWRLVGTVGHAVHASL